MIANGFSLHALKVFGIMGRMAVDTAEAGPENPF